MMSIPKSEGSQHNALLIFVDRLSKMAHLVPTSVSLNAPEFTCLFSWHVAKHHGVPSEIISYGGAQFGNQFWAEVCRQLGIQRCMSNAYHPQSDGQTERTNRTITEMVRNYVTPASCGRWPEHLPWIEYAYNNSYQEAVKTTPFFLSYGQHPRGPTSLGLEAQVPAAADTVKEVHCAVEAAKKSLLKGQKRMCKQVNRHRRPVEYSQGALVLLSTQNLRNSYSGQCTKLMPRWVGPFPIVGMHPDHMIGRAAVRLGLPPQWQRMHDVFHVGLVKPYRGEMNDLGEEYGLPSTNRLC